MEEIRKIPEGWEMKELRSLVQIINGTTPSRDNEDYWKQGVIPWVTPTDITSNPGKYIESTKEYISTKALEETSIKVIPKDSILMTSRATLGKLKINTGEMCTNQGFKNLVPKNIDVEFLYYLMTLLKSEYSKFGIGTTFLEVSKKDTERFEIVYPKSKKEQQKIAKILSTLDQNIEKTEQTIEKYKKIKSGLMDDLLTGKIRIKDGKWVKETEFKEVDGVGRVPKDWDLDILDNLTSERIKDGTHSTPIYVERGVPFLRVTDIHNKILKMDDMKYITEIEHKDLFRRVKPEYGDILYSKNGTIGIARIIDWNWEFSIFVSLALIKPNHSKIDNKFLEIILNSFVAKKQIQLRAKQGTVTNLHLEEIREFLIPLPDKKEQEEIRNILYKQDQLIQKEHHYLEKLKKLKAGLMEDLLTGKVRVKLEE